MNKAVNPKQLKLISEGGAISPPSPEPTDYASTAVEISTAAKIGEISPIRSVETAAVSPASDDAPRMATSSCEEVGRDDLRVGDSIRGPSEEIGQADLWAHRRREESQGEIEAPRSLPEQRPKWSMISGQSGRMVKETPHRVQQHLPGDTRRRSGAVSRSVPSGHG